MNSQDSGELNYIEVLRAARQGEESGLDRLYDIYLPPLRRFCLGRLPRWAVGIIDSDNLVRKTLLQVLRTTNPPDSSCEGDFQTALRSQLKERISQEIHSARDNLQNADLPLTPEGETSPLEELIGREGLHRYEVALSELDATDRQMIIARLELGFSYHEIASTLSELSEEKARIVITRALLRLAEKMYEVSRRTQDSR